MRTFENRRADAAIVVEDRVRFTTPQSFATALITLDRVHRRSADTVVVYDSTRALEITVAAEGGEWSYAMEEIENPGRPTPRRLGFSFNAPVMAARLCFTMRPAALAADLPGVYVDPPIGGDFQPLPDNAITVEAEAFTAESGGTVTVCDKPGASAGKGFKLWDKQGHRLEWTFDVAVDGRYAVQVRACHALTSEVTRQVLLDGQAVGDPSSSCPFPNTGGWSSDSDNWRDLYLVQQGRPLVLDLRAGRHVLALVADRDGGLNLDWLRLVPLK